ncbi:MAG: hypothetical protein AAGN82_10030 [Myxococcota bacterium]
MSDKPVDPERAKGARRVAFIVIGALLLIAIPFGRSIYVEYKAFKAYAAATIDDPAQPPAWTEEPFSPEDCVHAGLAWIDDCQGFEEFCRRAMPTVISRCMASGDREPWCREELAVYMRTTYGYDDCKRMVAEGKLDATRQHKHRCAEAYRGAANYCRRTYPQYVDGRR